MANGQSKVKMADSNLRAELMPERVDFRPDRADFRPERAWGD